MHQDRTPWGPALIALVFVVLGATAVVRFPDVPAVWIVVVLCALVAGWQVRTAVLRHLSDDETRD
jgi:hypothetical protein